MKNFHDSIISKYFEKNASKTSERTFVTDSNLL